MGLRLPNNFVEHGTEGGDWELSFFDIFNAIFLPSMAF
jgi:hypothetical protein